MNAFMSLTIILMLFTIGYAYLRTGLTINGTGYINKAEWDVHFENIVAKTGSVTPITAPSISNDTSVSFSVSLDNSGDFYEFNIDVVNDGTIPAMIDSISLSPTLTTEQSNYFEYGVTYSDGIAILPKHLLNPSTTETLRVFFNYKENDDIEMNPLEDQNFQFRLTLNYVQADDTASSVPRPVSFADDSWDTIISAAQSGNTLAYTVGSTKTVDMGSLGTHTLRVANNSTPAECSTAGFSQTACGFVLEFADIITTHRMNPYTDGSINGDGNRGGWEFSEMRAYLNSGKYLEGETGEVDYTTTGIYSSLPENLRNAIIETKVVSGHGNKDTTNFTTTDKLYLLSTHEVWEDNDGNTSNGIDYFDTAYNNTRQLDYYKSQNVTTSSYSGAIKQNNGSNSYWWLRSARSSNGHGFFSVSYSGSWDGNYSSSTTGASPAFRIS